MFYYYEDPVTNVGQNYMLPEFIEYFQGLMESIEVMEQTTGKWTQTQIDAYYLFLKDLKQYIITYVYPGYVMDFNDFMSVMTKYGEDQNPVGYELYNNQIDYLTMKSQGKHYKIEKKGKKNIEPKKEKPAVVHEEKKEEELVRKEDPTITAQELVNKSIDQSKYTADIVSFKK